MVSICPLLWQIDVKLQQTKQQTTLHVRHAGWGASIITQILNGITRPLSRSSVYFWNFQEHFFFCIPQIFKMQYLHKQWSDYFQIVYIGVVSETT